MFSTAPQASFRRVSGYCPDTEETLRLATQKLKQAPQQQKNIPHAYVIPIPVMPAATATTATQNDEQQIIGSTNGPTHPQYSHPQYQFTPIIPDGTAASGNTSASANCNIVTPTPLTSTGYLQYHDTGAISNFQTFNCSPHGGFLLPAGYRLVYAPTGTPQSSQPATPATPRLGNSHDGTPPSEQHHDHTTITNYNYNNNNNSDQ